MKLAQFLMDIYQRLYSNYGPQYWWPAATKFEVVLGAILTQNTAWVNVRRALENLREANCLTPSAIRIVSMERLSLLIKPSGYFNTKAKKLKAFANYLALYDDEIGSWSDRDPKELRSELLKIYGIGPETADDIVLYVAELPSFVIDTYTRRIISRVGIGPVPDTYDSYQALFEDNLPSQSYLYNEYHALLDCHAKMACTKQKPSCTQCCLRDLCRTGKSQD